MQVVEVLMCGGGWNVLCRLTAWPCAAFNTVPLCRCVVLCAVCYTVLCAVCCVLCTVQLEST